MVGNQQKAKKERVSLLKKKRKEVRLRRSRLTGVIAR